MDGTTDLAQISEKIWDLFRMAVYTAGGFSITTKSFEECSENRDELHAGVIEAEEWDLLAFRQARLMAKGADEAGMLEFDNLNYPTGGYYASYHDAAFAFARDLSSCTWSWCDRWDAIQSARVDPLGDAFAWAAARGINITADEQYEGEESEALSWYASLCSLEDCFRAGIEVEFAATGANRSVVTNGSKRFTPKACPQCKGQCRVERTVGRTRYVSCRSHDCTWRGKETG